MAFLSEILDDKVIPESDRNQAASCCQCGKTIEKGGMWAMNNLHLGICDRCAPILLDWYIDTLNDTQKLSEYDDIGNVQKLSNDIIDRYKRKKDKKKRLG